MEEINFEQQQIDMNELHTLYEKEKQERNSNNKIKCLEASINIVIKIITYSKNIKFFYYSYICPFKKILFKML